MFPSFEKCFEKKGINIFKFEYKSGWPNWQERGGKERREKLPAAENLLNFTILVPMWIIFLWRVMAEREDHEDDSHAADGELFALECCGNYGRYL